MIWKEYMLYFPDITLWIFLALDIEFSQRDFNSNLLVVFNLII